MSRTHISITIAAVLLFLPRIESQFIFIAVAMVTTFIPDIDSAFSYFGDNSGSRMAQLFIRHRGILHSLTFCVAVSLVFAFFIPVLAFPFFLAYSLHLFADSFTKKGIVPFWPLRKAAKGWVKTGGVRETSVFIFMVVLDMLLFLLVLKVF